MDAKLAPKIDVDSDPEGEFSKNRNNEEVLIAKQLRLKKPRKIHFNPKIYDQEKKELILPNSSHFTRLHLSGEIVSPLRDLVSKEKSRSKSASGNANNAKDAGKDFFKSLDSEKIFILNVGGKYFPVLIKNSLAEQNGLKLGSKIDVFGLCHTNRDVSEATALAATQGESRDTDPSNLVILAEKIQPNDTKETLKSYSESKNKLKQDLEESARIAKWISQLEETAAREAKEKKRKRQKNKDLEDRKRHEAGIDDIFRKLALRRN